MAKCGFEVGFLAVPCGEDAAAACGNRCYQHCSYGKDFNNRLMALHSKGLTDWQLNEKYRDIMELWMDHAVEFHNQPAPPTKSKNGKYNGPFAFTLTMSPADGLTEEDMIFACRKVMGQKSQPVKKFAWYLEYKDEETKRHPHIHGMYETENGRRIEKKHWQRSWKIWNEGVRLGAGHRGGYHREVYHDEAYSKYIAKDGGIGESHGV